MVLNIINETIDKINSKIRNKRIVYIGIVLMVFKTYLSSSRIFSWYSNKIDTLLVFFAMVFMALQWILDKHALKEWAISGFFVILAIINSLITGYYEIFITVVTCLSVFNDKFDKTVTFVFKISLLCFIVHLSICLYNIIVLNQNYIILYRNEHARYTMGFSHPNTFSMYLFNLITMYVFIYFKKLSYVDIFGIIVISSVGYYLTGTRTTLILTFVLIIFVMLSKTKISFTLNKISFVLFPLCTILIILLVFLYKNGNSLAVKFNWLLSGRAALGKYAYEKYGISFLGTRISEIGNNIILDDLGFAFTFDCIYTQLCVHYGLVWVVIIGGLFYKVLKHNDFRYFILVAIWCLYGITESSIINIYRFFPLLAFVTLNDKTNK